MTPTPSGLFGASRSVLATLVDIARTRLQLASTELEEERLRVAELLLYATAALFCLGLGTIFVALFLVLLFWDSHRLLTLGLIAAVFVGSGLGLAMAWRHKVRHKPGLLATTLAELQRDGEALRGQQAMSPPGRPKGEFQSAQHEGVPVSPP